MITENTQKNSLNFECINCNFKTCKKNDYKRHLLTDKHKRLQNNDKSGVENKKYICECGREYKYRQGLYNHRKSCKGEKKENIIIQTENKYEMKDLVFKLIRENQELKNTVLEENKELRKTITEMIPKL